MELALGDFTDLANNIKMYQDEKMVRTYFKQLLDGVEYLHENGISHLDLKLENLLLGEDYNLKISDFDVSFFERDRKIRSLGTMNYRAPEIKDQVGVSPQKADIFSLGVILFCMMVGYHPYQEEKVIAGYNLYDLLLSNPTEFMAAHEKLDSHVKNFPSEFKDFFLSMAKKDPEERPVISKLKQHNWLNGPVYAHQELKELIPKLLKSN
jgi:serine/threonine protein kinase